MNSETGEQVGMGMGSPPPVVFLNIRSPLSFSGDIQDPPGQGPVQPAVGDPASAGGLD